VHGRMRIVVRAATEAGGVRPRVLARQCCTAAGWAASETTWRGSTRSGTLPLDHPHIVRAHDADRAGRA